MDKIETAINELKGGEDYANLKILTRALHPNVADAAELKKKRDIVRRVLEVISADEDIKNNLVTAYSRVTTEKLNAVADPAPNVAALLAQDPQPTNTAFGGKRMRKSKAQRKMNRRRKTQRM